MKLLRKNNHPQIFQNIITAFVKLIKNLIKLLIKLRVRRLQWQKTTKTKSQI